MKKKVLIYPLILCSLLMINILSCSKTDSTPDITTPAPTCSGTPGPLFTAVKNLMAQKCVSCHNASNANGGQNWQVDCNIVAGKARIKARAVDEGTMPPTGTLPQADKNIITAWINAGGRLTD